MKRITFLFTFLFATVLVAQGSTDFVQSAFGSEPGSIVYLQDEKTATQELGIKSEDENPFDEDDIAFFVGEGEHTAYIIIDFREDDEQGSFAWGVNFDGNDLTLHDALLTIQEENFNFSFEADGNPGSYFLEDIYYNQYQGVAGDPDWWSSWTGTSPEDFEMNMGVGEDLEDAKWYGFSYGFSPEPKEPEFVYAAYNADWFGFADVDSWFGEGDNQAIITIDFVTDQEEENVSFAWGLQFEEEAISGKIALETLADLDENLEVTFDDADQLVSINYNGLQKEAGDNESWKAFIGSSMSDYALAADGIFEMIENGNMFGISFGGAKVRRPYIPILVENTGMGIADVVFETTIKVWPNPTVDKLHLETSAEIQNLRVFDMQGRKVLQGQNKELNVSNLSSGNYLLQIQSDKAMVTKRFIKQ